MKVRLKFEKNIRYISHLELMRSIQKILKRSQLPLKYSEGFNPHIILSIAAPVSVGVCGKSEYADFELKEEISKDEILDRLKNSADDSIKPVDICVDYKKNLNSVIYAKYKIEIITEDSDKIIEFFNRSEINTEKKAKGKIKIINMREYIHKIDFEKTENGLIINALLACGNEKNLNPMLMRKAMLTEGIKIQVFNATRTNIFDGEMKEFME